MRATELTVNDCGANPPSRISTRAPIWADSPREVAAASEVVFTSLPGPKEAESVGNTMLDAMPANSAWFDLSTNSRQSCAAYTRAMLKRISPCSTLRVRTTRRGEIGQARAVDRRRQSRVRPFSARARCNRRSGYLYGDIGAGSVAKLCTQLRRVHDQTALAEVFTLGVKAGVDPLELWSAGVRPCSLGRIRTFDRLANNFCRARSSRRFALQLAHKDVTLATELGRELGVPMRVANLTYAERQRHSNRGWAQRDSRVPLLAAGRARRRRHQIVRRSHTGGIEARRLRRECPAENASRCERVWPITALSDPLTDVRELRRAGRRSRIFTTDLYTYTPLVELELRFLTTLPQRSVSTRKNSLNLGRIPQHGFSAFREQELPDLGTVDQLRDLRCAAVE